MALPVNAHKVEMKDWRDLSHQWKPKAGKHTSAYARETSSQKQKKETKRLLDCKKGIKLLILEIYVPIAGGPDSISQYYIKGRCTLIQ